MRQQRSFVFLSKLLKHILDFGMTFLSWITFICMRKGWSHRNSRFFWREAYKKKQETLSVEAEQGQGSALLNAHKSGNTGTVYTIKTELKLQLAHFLKCNRLHSGSKHAPAVGILPNLMLLLIKANLIRTQGTVPEYLNLSLNQQDYTENVVFFYCLLWLTLLESMNVWLLVFQNPALDCCASVKNNAFWLWRTFFQLPPVPVSARHGFHSQYVWIPVVNPSAIHKKISWLSSQKLTAQATSYAG